MTVYRMISAEKATGFPVSVACALLGLSRSAYYDWERGAPSDRALADAWLLEQIQQIYAAKPQRLRSINAVTESFFATLKKELVNRRSWRTRRELMSEVFESIEAVYMRAGRHSTLGYVCPPTTRTELS